MFSKKKYAMIKFADSKDDPYPIARYKILPEVKMVKIYVIKIAIPPDKVWFNELIDVCWYAMRMGLINDSKKFDNIKKDVIINSNCNSVLSKMYVLKILPRFKNGVIAIISIKEADIIIAIIV